jgi:hypothetical protein
LIRNSIERQTETRSYTEFVVVVVVVVVHTKKSKFFSPGQKDRGLADESISQLGLARGGQGQINHVEKGGGNHCAAIVSTKPHNRGGGGGWSI